ncbi:hypothetical protein [Chitinophaga filiformis]|uniref:Transposase n=1 Tax=Chitinophaga filiformis TaxID=104663 RepID=A0ABY4I5N7_CHIFI|nr:hypothetical protein [Chitinophaga filiformis]UPK71185.1 hypothetical protein MYF79_07810 [Chitinophaga filiformis]
MSEDYAIRVVLKWSLNKQVIQYAECYQHERHRWNELFYLRAIQNKVKDGQ